jgi:hypothetical protein
LQDHRRTDHLQAHLLLEILISFRTVREMISDGGIENRRTGL